MRFPRLRLPQLRLSFEWIGALGGRSTLLYVGYTLLLFVVFVLLTFPHELLVRRALSSVNRGPVGIDFKAVNFAWFNGYQLSGTRVGPLNSDHTPYLECSRVWVRPAWGALVRGNPYNFLVEADLYGGQARGELSLAGGGVDGWLQWRGLDVGRYRTLTALLDEGQIGGKVSGQFSFQARSNLGAGQASGEIVLDGASINAGKVKGFPVPDIKLRQTRMKFQMQSGHVELQEVEVTGDVNAQGSGQIVLREPLLDSTLNLRASIVTSLETPDTLKAAVALIPRPPGAKPDAPITITGTLGSPRIR
jgi:type II secretion system protein N